MRWKAIPHASRRYRGPPIVLQVWVTTFVVCPGLPRSTYDTISRVSDAHFFLMQDPYRNPYRNKEKWRKQCLLLSPPSQSCRGIQRLSGLDGWKDSIAIRERSFGAKKGDTYMSWMRTSNRDESHIDETSKAPKATSSRLKPLDDVVRAAMKKCESDLQRELGNFHCPDEVNFQDRVTICDHEFTTYHMSESHGVVFF